MSGGSVMAGVSNLQNLQYVSQGLSQANETLGAYGISLSPADWLASCKSVAADEDAAEEFEEDTPETSQMGTYLWRMCVHSAEQLPRDRTMVCTTIEGSDKEHHTPIAPASPCPVWESCFDQEVTFADRPPTVSLRIYGKRSLSNIRLRDKLLGTATFRLPHKAGEGPRRQWLKVVVPESFLPLDAMGCTVAGSPKLQVVWQLCEVKAHQDFRPDLNRVAEMEPSSMENETYSVYAKIIGLSLRTPAEQKKVFVSLRLKKPGSDATQHFPNKQTPSIVTWPQGMALAHVGVGDVDPTVHGCVEAFWPAEGGQSDEDGWEMKDPWRITASPVMLLGYFMEVTVHELLNNPRQRGLNRLVGWGSEERVAILGSWREPLGELLDVIEQTDQRLLFDAELSSRESGTLGQLRIELDIITKTQIRHPTLRVPRGLPTSPATPGTSSRALAKVSRIDMRKATTNLTSASGPVPVRSGTPSVDAWQQKVTYHCTFFADGLPPTLGSCHPYIRISMAGAAGASSAQTEVKSEHCVNSVTWANAAVITTKALQRKAKVQLWNSSAPSSFISNSLGLPTEDELLGEAAIYDVTPDKEYWLHFYGGALAAPKTDVAHQMVKGAVKPPSTYIGSVAVHFGMRRQPLHYVNRLMDRRAERLLVVRLNMGTNLYHYARPGGRHVKVFIQVAGCRVSDQQEMQKHKQVLGGKPGMEAETASREQAVPQGDCTTRNLLCFPAEVDAGGILRFKDTRRGGDPRSQPNCTWIERRAPRSLLVPPGVTHAYAYVVAEGEEHRPPQVFCRFRIQDEEPAECTPKWKRVRYDVSVLDLPESSFKTNLAGFLLGSASLIQVSSRAAFARSSRSKSSLNSASRDRPGPPGRPTPPPPPTEIPVFACCREVTTLSHSSDEVDPEVCCQHENPKLRKTLYCHVDMLAARELPSMDDDGLADPLYQIQVLDKEITQPGSIAKSLSPSFMHRIIIPFEMELNEGLKATDVMASSRVPLPPVIVRLLDFDEKRLLGQLVGGEFELIGAVVVKHHRSSTGIFKFLNWELANCYKHENGYFFTDPPEALDLNQIHFPLWHALDEPAVANFDSRLGGIDGSWLRRPRVLTAIGYSQQRELVSGSLGEELQHPEILQSVLKNDGQVWTIRTSEYECLQMEISLLGLRTLPSSLYNAKLLVSSFWNGRAAEFEIGSNFSGQLNQNPTFPQLGWEHTWDEQRVLDFQVTFEAGGADNISGRESLGLVWEWDLHEVYEDEFRGLLVTEVLRDGAVDRWNKHLLADDRDPHQYIMPGDRIVKVNGIEHDLPQELEKTGQQQWELDVVRVRSWRAFARKVQDILHLTGPEQEIPEQEVDDDGRRAVSVLDLRGVSVRPPICPLPIIPYLQAKEIPNSRTEAKKSNWSHTSAFERSNSDVCARTGRRMPFVLKPAIICQLKNELAGTDYGTLTVGMNRLHVDSINGLSTWMNSFIEEFSALPDDLKKWNTEEDKDDFDHCIAPIPNLRFDDDAYDIFVDVFAAESGYLNFEPEMRLGRPLTEQRLFVISARGRGDKETTQFFNPGDWMASDAAFSTEPFDKRVSPSLWCGKFDTEDARETQDYANLVRRCMRMTYTGICCCPGFFMGCVRRKYDRRVIYTKAKDLLRSEQLWEQRWLLDEETLKNRCIPRHAWELQLNRPKGPSELLEGAFGLSVDSVKSSVIRPVASVGSLLDKTTDRVLSTQRKGEKVILRHARTGELQKELRKAGWRSTSHLVAPETNLEKNTLFTDLIQSGKATLQHNLHTFVRPVGHVISDSDRDSHILARLRMGLPTHHVAELKRQLEKAKKDLKDARIDLDALGLPKRERSDNNSMEEDEEKLRRLMRAVANVQGRMDKLIAAEKSNCNFMLVKFRRRGTVIWSAPDHVYTWSKPGTILFVVQLMDEPDCCIPVWLPNFDIRFHREQGWYPCKTLLRRWRDVENKIDRGEKHGRVRGEAGIDKRRLRRRRPPVPVAATNDVEDGGSDNSSNDEGLDSDSDDPDGYSRSILVSKHAFVCRIRRRKGANFFDRQQTKDWYHAVLEDMFEELRYELEADDPDVLRNRFLSAFMNLRMPLTTRKEAHLSRLVPILKGHICMKRVRDPTSCCTIATCGDLPFGDAPQEMEFGELAVENLWIHQRVFVQCCVLTGQELELGSLGLKGNLKPYLKARLGPEQQQSKVVENLPKQGSIGAAQFYSSFVFETSFPGISTMEVEVWHKGLISDTLLGTCQFDIEDRYLTMRVREMREGTKEKFLRDGIAPNQVRYCSPLPSAKQSSGWVDPPYVDPEKDFGVMAEGKTIIPPRRGPGSRMPIEVHDIQRQDAETGTESRSGVLRMWVNITPTEAGPEKDIEVPKLADFELRITIWRISNICVFRDYGVRNDVYVKGKFKAVDMHGNETVAFEKTDIHRFANDEASFNWRWVFKTPAPVQDATLELIMMDEDRLSAHDQIYHPVVYPLDHLLSVAYENHHEGRRPLGVLHETVVFDSWNDETAVETLFSQYCRCCWRRSGMARRKFAHMHMDVQLLPMQEAQSDPVEAGNVAAPKNRLSLGTALAEPVRTVKILIGARLYWKTYFLTATCIISVIILLLSAFIYFVINIVNA